MAQRPRPSSRPVVIRFFDDEIMEGRAEDLNFDAPDFVLRIDKAASNNERALIPLPSVKRVTFGARPPTPAQLVRATRKVAIRFQDGEILKGYLNGTLQHARYGLTMRLINVEKDRLETLGIPYSALKAMFYVKSWDSRPPEFGGQADAYVARRLASPLVELLSDMRSLARLRKKGTITGSEFERKRKKLLDTI